MQTNATQSDDIESPAHDLGPLAWVLDELRKSLDSATKALRRFVRDADLARGSELAELDASQLRIARQQLHQAVGALEMVGQEAPAKVLRAMEALAQKFVQRPEQCSDDAAAKVERASFALTEYLEGVLKGRTASPVALFPQYRDVLEQVAGERVHPADLWPLAWRWADAAVPDMPVALAYDPSVRSRMDQAVLKVVKVGDPVSALALRDISLGFACAQMTLEPRVFWKIAAAYFEAMAHGLCPSDLYAKRAASRVLTQYATLAKGDLHVSDRLAQDLLFYCAQAASAMRPDTPVLLAVCTAYGLARTEPVDYETPKFGRFDPALLAQARKRIASATETWSALAGGDSNRLKVAAEQFASVSESLLKLHPESGDLAHALTRAVDATVRSGEPPATAVAMEVATSVLYLDAAYEDLDPLDASMAERSARLAQRLEHVVAGGQPEPLEGWMEELYRRVSDRQTMGSVVDELRNTLGSVEKSLDQFFRNPQDKMPLHEVPSQLAQMRGVFSVLGLDQASLAALRMRGNVEKFLIDVVDEATIQSGVFEKLGSSLGAMGFLIDMLGYQRALAKNLFVYDEDLAEFKPLMGREKVAVIESPAPSALPEEQAPANVPITAADDPSTAPSLLAALPDTTAPVPLLVAPVPAVPLPRAPVQPDLDDDDAELRDIFLDEAREVVQTGLGALRALAATPSDLGEQTTLRRAFHTLKGSSRMVGLNEFGEAAWSFEQLLNTWLAEQKPASDGLIGLSTQAMQAFGRWVEDIAAGTDLGWTAPPFRKAADAMRMEHMRVPLLVPGVLADEPVVHEVVAEPLSEAHPDLEVAPIAVGAAIEDLTSLAVPEANGPENMVAVPTPAEPEPEPHAVAEEESTELAAIELEMPLPRADFAATQLVDLADFAPTQMAPAASEAVPAEPTEYEPLSVSLDFGDLLKPEVPAAPVAPIEADAIDDQIKVIGDLHVSLPLYNVYLNEADEWSRRLMTELSEWAMELHRPMPDSVVALAHSLSGSSATVGFTALSDIARTLEQALGHVQLHGQSQPEHAAVFNEAAEDIRRLLHQFAAGFLRKPDATVVDKLNDILAQEFARSALAGTESVVPLDEAAVADLLTSITDQVEPLPVTAVPWVDMPKPAFAATAFPLATEELQIDEDDIDAVDTLDADLFPIFEEEAVELLPQLGGALRQWAARPDNLSARSEALRVLHTLKGSARLAGAMRLGEMAHRMESSIEHLGNDPLQAAAVEPLLSGFDMLAARFDHLRATPGQVLSLPEVPKAGSGVAEEDTAATVVADETAEVAETELPRRALLAASATLPVPRQASNQTVRVRSQLLDRLLNQAGEVIITRSRLDARLGQLRSSLGELTGNLDRLRHQLRDIEVQAESQMQSRLALAKDTAQGFDPLEFDRFTRVQELTRMMAESVNDVATVQRNLQRAVEGAEDDIIAQARQARELQRDLLRTRMVEFESISERLYGVVRQASKDVGKQVKLDIVGGSMDLDRSVLERMAPAFEHMLRNAVAHGIEDATVRVAADKPAAGTIRIEVQQESNSVSVAFSDDGAGLDAKRIRAKALANGLIAADAVLSEAETANLIFTPGFSTADVVSELSGRGIGLDVVRSEVNALGGRIETTSTLGTGTQFRLVLPLTTAVTQVVMLRLGELAVGVPANMVETIRRVPADDLAAAYAAHSFTHEGEAVPFFWGGALLQASARSHEPPSKHMAVAIFRSAGQRVAAHVDEVLGNQEVVVKNLGPQLSRLPGLTGMSVLASGAVALIYNPVALATVYGAQARQLSASAIAAQAAGASDLLVNTLGATLVPLVLVVDDSITVRRVTQRLLKREGYRVALAADGLQALEKLKEEKPAVVLSDIEMPRMDGFDLARNIRADENLRDLPIIMITSRIADKHREHARELGVDHYLGKPYPEDELLGLVRNYCALVVEG